MSPAGLPLSPALRINESGNPRLFWNTATSGSRSSIWAQVMPATPQVTTVEVQSQPFAPVAVPSNVSTVVQTFSGIAVWS